MPNAPAPFSTVAVIRDQDGHPSLVEFFPVGTKHCPACGQDKPLHAFEVSYPMGDNLYYVCRKCKKEGRHVRKE